MNQMKFARAFFVVGLCALASGCLSTSTPSRPESKAATRWLATDITQYRNTKRPAVQPLTVNGLRDGDLALFTRVYDRVRTMYVRDVDENSLKTAAAEGMRRAYPDPTKAPTRALVEAAINGMLASLDPYSSYLDQAHWRALREQTSGEFGGIGIQVRKGEGYIEVISPIDGTPAAKAGVLPGDHILRADGKSFKKMQLRDAVLMLRGRPGSHVTLTLRRQKLQQFDLSIMRDIIKVASVRFRTETDIGYIRISRFSERTGAEVMRAVVSIKARVGAKLKGFVLDLRSNPGGLFDQSIEVSDVFLSKGTIVSTRARVLKRHYQATKGDETGGLPIVVLIDKGSASAAEIVAGALKDHKRATLIGTRSFGKGSVQTILPLSVDDRLKLTTAVYLTPSGRSVEGGITPHVTVPMSDKKDGDDQLKYALSFLRKHRP
jgi:carboxyl-terminal processing protease